MSTRAAGEIGDTRPYFGRSGIRPPIEAGRGNHRRVAVPGSAGISGPRLRADTYSPPDLPGLSPEGARCSARSWCPRRNRAARGKGASAGIRPRELGRCGAGFCCRVVSPARRACALADARRDSHMREGCAFHPHARKRFARALVRKRLTDLGSGSAKRAHWGMGRRRKGRTRRSGGPIIQAGPGKFRPAPSRRASGAKAEAHRRGAAGARRRYD